MKSKDLMIFGGLALGAFLLYKFFSGGSANGGGGGAGGGGDYTVPLTGWQGSGIVGGQIYSKTTDRYINPRTPFIQSTYGTQLKTGYKYQALTSIPRLKPQIVVTGSGYGYLKTLLGPSQVKR